VTDTYISILEAPLDPYTVPDVGDSRPQHLTEKPALAPTGPLAAPTLLIPFTRLIEEGSVGKDVLGAKRAIWRANGLPVPKAATKTFGPIAAKQLQVFQHKHGLPADGKLGPETLRNLGPFFDRYAFLLYEGYPPGGTLEERIRNAIVAYALWGYNQRPQIHYGEYRPMDNMNDLEHLPETEDCSTFATKAYKFGGAPDPNGLGYNGAGNTSTARAHGRVVTLDQAQPADLPQYLDPDHEAVYVGSRRVVSHGSEIGPLLQAVDYRPVYQIRSYL